MTQTVHIDRVRRRTLSERIQALVNTDPVILFNGFYILFGFTLTISFFAAAFLALTWHRPCLVMLFITAPASTAVWGIAYAAWTDTLKVAWSTLAVVATLGLIAAIFVVLTQSDQSGLLRQLIIEALAVPALWTAIFWARRID
jgi:hypothetical protein